MKMLIVGRVELWGMCPVRKLWTSPTDEECCFEKPRNCQRREHASIWEFLSILELRVKKICWASKYMSTVEIFAIHFRSAEDFDGCQPTVKLWGVVIQPYCIIQHKEPQLDVILLRPMDRKVEHHGSSHVVYCSNCSFGSRILMVGADS